MPEAQNADVFGQAVMPQEEELQMDIDTLQMRIDAEVTENPNGPRPQNWMTELLEEPLIPEPAVQEIEQTQALDMLGELQVLTDEEMEELLALL